MSVSTRAVRRVLSLFTASALLAGLMVGTPSAARAGAVEPSTQYVAVAGNTYVGAFAADCNSTTFKADSTDDNEEVDSAVAAAAGGRVYFCAGDYFFTGVVDPGVSELVGASAASTSISGSEITRIFVTMGNIVLSGLTLRHGRSTGYGGGAILATGDVTVNDAVFTDNFSDSGGGAIAAEGAVTVTDSAFTNNSTTDRGGAIGSNADVTVDSSVFTTNSSIADENCIGGGGAIAAAGSVSVLGGVFRGNRAEVDPEVLDACNWNPIDVVTDPYDGALGGLGGAIAAIGRVDLEGGLYTGNFAEAGGGAVMAAGRDFVDSCLTSSLVLGATFTNNSTNPRLARAPVTQAYIGDTHFGGGALLTGTCELNIADSTFTGNSSMAVGGAVNGTTVTVYDSTFTGNSVKGSIYAIPEEGRFAGSLGGGAIAGINVYVFGSTFLRNSGPSGGAILTVAGCAIMQSNTFTGNQATAREIGYGGGAVHSIQLFCTSIFTDNLFSSNSAAGDGGALWGGVWVGVELSAAQIRSIIETPEGWTTNNTYSRNRAANGGAIAISTPLPIRVRYSTRRIERTNNVKGNVGGKNSILALVHWGE